MATTVSWNLQLSVQEGRLDEARSLMSEMVEATRAEAGTLGYEWFLTEDGTTCHICERYADSAAALEHLGNFGANFAERFLACFAPTGFYVYGEPSDEVRAGLAPLGVTSVAAIAELPANLSPQIVMLAVKPQQMESVMAPVATAIGSATIVLSIAAGTTIGFFEKHLGANRAVVRVMPNTPAAVGRGVSVLCANERADAAARERREALMRSAWPTMRPRSTRPLASKASRPPRRCRNSVWTASDSGTLSISASTRSRSCSPSPSASILAKPSWAVSTISSWKRESASALAKRASSFFFGERH